MELNVQIYSNSLIALYKTDVDFLYIFTYGSWFPHKTDKTMVLLVNALLECSSV